MADVGRDPAIPDTRCHFFRVPMELRDDIYDYVAYGEQTLGLHANMTVVTKPKVHCYDEGLSRTCTQIRQEYTIRLQRRIKQMMAEDRAPVVPYGWTGETLCPVIRSQTILIAEREVTEDFWVQIAVASRSVMPFRGLYDQGRHASTLTFTLASSALRRYNRWFGIREKASRKVPTWDRDAVVEYLSLLEDAAKPRRPTGPLSSGADMNQPMWMSANDKVLKFSRLGVVGMPGFEDPQGGLKW